MIRTYQVGDDQAIVETWKVATVIAHPFMKEDFIAQEAKNIVDIYLPNTKNMGI